MAKFNYKKITTSVASSEPARKRVNTIAQNKFTKAHAKMMEEFDNHPVTKEIEAGPLTVNISNTLSGAGDLFSFIGFEQGLDPVDELRAILSSQTKLINSSRPTVVGGAAVRYTFSLRIPSEAIRAATPIPWEMGKSWAEGIEKGISGFSQFMQGYFLNSRSGGGVQIERNIRNTQFRPVPYLSEIFGNVPNNFKNL